MLSLFALWSLSLIVVIAIIVFAYLRMRQRGIAVSSGVIPSQFTEFFGDQFHDMFLHALQGFHHAKPHATQIGMIALTWSNRGRDLFVERIFGRTEQKRGNTVSFFLKHIAEHQKQGQRGDI